MRNLSQDRKHKRRERETERKKVKEKEREILSFPLVSRISATSSNYLSRCASLTLQIAVYRHLSLVEHLYICGIFNARAIERATRDEDRSRFALNSRQFEFNRPLRGHLHSGLSRVCVLFVPRVSSYRSRDAIGRYQGVRVREVFSCVKPATLAGTESSFAS